MLYPIELLGPVGGSILASIGAFVMRTEPGRNGVPAIPTHRALPTLHFA